MTRLVTHVAFALIPALVLGVPVGDARAQILNEECTANVLNRRIQVNPNGTFAIGNVPISTGAFRVRIVCERPSGLTERARSEFLVGVPIIAGGLTVINQITFGDDEPIPVALGMTASSPMLTPTALTAQITTTGTLVSGVAVDLTQAQTGTFYLSSNQAIGTVLADGLVTGVSSGTVLVTATHEGIIATIALTVALTDDTDGDGIPDDFELANAPALDPNNPADAALDFDGDGLTNLAEFIGGTSLLLADTDGDGLNDSQEVKLGSNPLLGDSDNDGLLDGNETNPGSDFDGDGLKNILDPDSDNDNLPDGIEIALGLFHLDTDTDNDNIPDGNEDTDNDGLANSEEVLLNTNPGNPDTDGDGLTDGEEVLVLGTDPLRADSSLPVVTLTNPASGAQLVEGETITLTADATDDGRVTRVDFLVDGAVVNSETTAPYFFAFVVPFGVTSLTMGATAVDTANNAGVSGTAAVSVSPDPLTTVIGTVIEVNGNPVAGATVTTVNNLSGVTQADGTFVFTNVPTIFGAIQVQASAVLNSTSLIGSSIAVSPVRGGTTDVGQIMIATIRWDGGGDGTSWGDPLNWNTDTLPMASDIVLIPPGSTVTHSNLTTSIKALRSTSALVVSSGILTLADESLIDNDFTLSSGTVTGSGDLTVTGAWTWTGGTMAGTGLLTLPAGSTTTLSGTVQKVLVGRTLNQAGTVTWSAGQLRMQDGPVINNQVGGVWDIQTDDDLGHQSGTLGTLNNAGVIRKTVGGQTTQLQLVLNNTGTVEGQSGTLEWNQGFTQTAGATFVNGGTVSSTTPLDIQGGTVGGVGTIAANITNAGQLRPGGPPGVLTIAGNYTQTASGSLHLEIGGPTAGTQFDQLAVTGAATLNGTLGISLINGFIPSLGDLFPVMTCGICTGAFGTIVGGTGFDVQVNSTDVTLNVVGPTGPSGGTVDGTVRFANGTPVPFPSVFATQVDGNGQTNSFFASSTDANGVYQVTGPVVGDVTVMAQDTTSGFVGTALGIVQDIAVPITVDVDLPPSGMVTGTVLDQTSNGVPFAEVALTSPTLGFALLGQADAQGVYQFAQVPLGTSQVQGCDTTATGHCAEGQGTLTTMGQTLTVDLTLPMTGTVQGTVFETDGLTPLPNALVTVEQPTPQGPLGFYNNSSTADSGGAYQATTVPEGTARVTAIDPSDPTLVGMVEGSLTAGNTVALDVVVGTALTPPVNLDGTDGYRYDVDCRGTLVGGGTVTQSVPDAYDGGATVLYATVQGDRTFPCLAAVRTEDAGRELEIGPFEVDGFTLSRKIFVPTRGGFARYLEIITNPTAAALALHVEVRSNLGSDSNTNLVVAPVTTGNTYVVTDDTSQGTATDPVVAQVFGGAGAPVTAAALQFQYGLDETFVRWENLTVQPGQTVLVMHYAVQRNPGDTAGAQTQAQALADLTDPNALTGMTPAERNQVVNFLVP